MQHPYEHLFSHALVHRPQTLAALRDLVAMDPLIHASDEHIVFETKAGSACYHHAELESLHAGLSCAVDCVKKKHLDTLRAYYLMPALDHWLTPGLAIPGTTYFLRDIVGLWYTPSTKGFDVVGEMYSVWKPEDTIELGVRTAVSRAHVSSRWLEKYFPGAPRQAALLRDMGVTDPTEVAQLVLHGLAAAPSKSASSSLPDATFID